MKILIFFNNNNENFLILVFEKFVSIRKFSIHRSYFVNSLFIIFFIFNILKRLKNRIILTKLNKLKEKIDIIF